MSDRYDAGLLGNAGGGDVEWWHDYIRTELERAHDFYSDECFALAANQCHDGYASENGDHRCREVDRLRAQVSDQDTALQAWKEDLEAAVQLVRDASLSTGHAGTCTELMREVLEQHQDLRAELRQIDRSAPLSPDAALLVRYAPLSPDAALLVRYALSALDECVAGDGMVAAYDQKTVSLVHGKLSQVVEAIDAEKEAWARALNIPEEDQ